LAASSVDIRSGHDRNWLDSSHTLTSATSKNTPGVNSETSVDGYEDGGKLIETRRAVDGDIGAFDATALLEPFNVSLRLLISQGHDHRQPGLVPYTSGDVALTSQVFRENHVPRADALNGPIPYLDLCLAG
jgi:hypothetical protein